MPESSLEQQLQLLQEPKGSVSAGEDAVIPKDPLLLRTSPPFIFRTFEDPVRRRFRLEAEEKLKPGAWQVLASGFNRCNFVFAAYRFLRKAVFAPDDVSYEGFDSLPKEVQEQMLEGIPEDRQHPIYEAGSLQQAELISSNLKKAFEARRILREAGWGGFAARLLAIILDLPFILGVVILVNLIKSRVRKSTFWSLTRLALQFGASSR